MYPATLGHLWCLPRQGVVSAKSGAVAHLMSFRRFRLHPADPMTKGEAV